MRFLATQKTDAMNTTNVNTRKENSSLIIHATTAILVTLFLFYIDEGYYNFKWMLSIGNWICFFVYAGMLFGGQILVKMFLFEKFSKTHIILACIIGSAIGLIFTITVLFRG